jgi:hypothetical protein
MRTPKSHKLPVSTAEKPPDSVRGLGHRSSYRLTTLEPQRRRVITNILRNGNLRAADCDYNRLYASRNAPFRVRKAHHCVTRTV